MKVLNLQDAVKFEKDAKIFIRRVTKSKETARKLLIMLGIYNKEGKLTKNYK